MEKGHDVMDEDLRFRGLQDPVCRELPTTNTRVTQIRFGYEKDYHFIKHRFIGCESVVWTDIVFLRRLQCSHEQFGDCRYRATTVSYSCHQFERRI